jgi:uncharacterized LabA/DUF88 family protein
VKRVRAYVDGFNLYHGLHEGFGRAYLWLDMETLVAGLLRADQHLDRVKYFTARVRRADDSRFRQVTYLEALAAHCTRLDVVEGRFQEKSSMCFACRARWTTYEEKESDVSLAVSLVEDAALDRFDIALIVSADSDLCPAIRAARRVRPSSRIVAVFPPKRHSDELKRVADAVYWLGRDKLRRAQLPAKVVTANGIELTRPEHWA